MPVKILGKTYEDHDSAVKALKASKPDISDPDAYVATVERQEKGAKLKSRFSQLQKEVKQDEGKSEDVLKLKGQERPPFKSKGTGEEESSSKQQTKTKEDPVKIRAKTAEKFQKIVREEINSGQTIKCRECGKQIPLREFGKHTNKEHPNFYK